MMITETKYAEIQDNLCVNTMVCEDETFADSMGWVPLPDGFGIGDSYENGEWTKAVCEEEEEGN